MTAMRGGFGRPACSFPTLHLPGRRAGRFRFRSLTWPTISRTFLAARCGAPENADRALDLYNALSNENDAEDPHSDGFLLSIQPEHGGTHLWMYDDGNGDPEHVIQFVKRCAAEFGLTGRWGFQYANTCSKPRIDAFGGGAHVLDLATGETVDWIHTDGWLAETPSDEGDRI